MATRKAQTKVEKIEKAKVADLPRFQIGEMGYLGLKQTAGVTYEELKRELNFPESMTTYKQMSYHSTIASALSLYEVMVGKVDWKIDEPINATEEEKRQTEFIRECMDDMEHTWEEFIQEVISMKTYGFSIHEKVFRRRNSSSGSKFNDNKIGWRKLPIRSQDTVDEFIFSDDGRDLLGVKQNLSRVEGYKGRFSKAIKNTEIVIPKSKFLLFRTGKHRGNPFGKSDLRNCYFAWKYLTQIEETEAVGIQRDLAGLPVIYIPPQYMAADASPEQKAIYEYYKNVIRNIQMNQQSGLVLPQAYDPDTKMPLFKMDLLTAEGGKQFDTTKVKEYYKNLILTAMFADILILGQSQTGSYALGSLKTSLLGVAVEAVLTEIVNVINSDLIRQTYQLNGWDVSRMCKVDYDGVEDIDLESFSKAIQRYSTTGMLERDRELMNAVRQSIGVDPYPDDAEVQEDILTGNTSRSGDGMKTVGEGTSTSIDGDNDNDNNMDNVG